MQVQRGVPNPSTIRPNIAQLLAWKIQFRVKVLASSTIHLVFYIPWHDFLVPGFESSLVNFATSQ